MVANHKTCAINLWYGRFDRDAFELYPKLFPFQILVKLYFHS